MNGNNTLISNLDLTQHTPDSIVMVAVLGAESTGKTTLCKDLAAHLKGLWVPEYMRSYLQNKWDTQQATCTWDDLLPIAQGQIDLENKIVKQAAEKNLQVTDAKDIINYVFCDTSLFELMIYAHWYYDDCPTQLTKAALRHHYDLTLLTEVDVPWVADDLRDSPNDRLAIRAYFESRLSHFNKLFSPIGGTRSQRVAKVEKCLNDLI